MTNRPEKEMFAIIGAGVAGVAMAGALQDYGVDFRVFDRKDRAGGLWVDNYPGATGELVGCVVRRVSLD